MLFNNNFEDWGMRNARRMTQLLGDAAVAAAGAAGGSGAAPRAQADSAPFSTRGRRRPSPARATLPRAAIGRGGADEG